MPENLYRWNTNAVLRILERREYTGCTVNFKTYTTSLKFKKRWKTRLRTSAFLRIPSPPSLTRTVGTGTGTSEEQTQADKNRKNQHFLRPALLRRLRGQAVFLHLQYLQRRQPESFCLLQLQEQHRLLQNPLYPGTGALPDCAGNHTADIELCPYVPEGFQAGNAGAGRGKPQAELAEKQKALSGAKKRMEDLDRIIQHIYEDNVLGKLSDSRYLNYPANTRRNRRKLNSLPLYWNGKLRHRPGRFPM